MNFTALKDMALAWIRGMWGKAIPAIKAEPIATFGLPLALAGALLFSWAFEGGVDRLVSQPRQTESVGVSIEASDVVVLFGQRLDALEMAVADLQFAQPQPTASALRPPTPTAPAHKPTWGPTDLDRAISAFPSSTQERIQ